MTGSAAASDRSEMVVVLEVIALLAKILRWSICCRLVVIAALSEVVIGVARRCTSLQPCQQGLRHRKRARSSELLTRSLQRPIGELEQFCDLAVAVCVVWRLKKAESRLLRAVSAIFAPPAVS